MKEIFSISKFRDQSIHIVGVTGSEGSAILRFLKKEKFTNITVHDYGSFELLEKNFKLWHKGMGIGERNDAFHIFEEDIKTVHRCFGDDYLRGIESADIIFAPQSWRLYEKQNAPLFKTHDAGIPFYSLTSLYLDLCPGKVIAVTGTVGKGSTSHLIWDVLKESGKEVYYGGNDTWNRQPLEDISSMSPNSYLILEVSHRQLQEGICSPPAIAVLTNLYPNHLDEISLEEYKKMKYSLFTSQTSSDIAILNKDYEDVREVSERIKSKIVFFSRKDRISNTKYVQEIYDYFLNKKNDHFLENILSAATVLELLGISVTHAIKVISQLKPPPARMQKIREEDGVEWYDDVKSTTPWATQALAGRLGKDTILIMGGETKGIDYKNILRVIRESVSELIILKSDLEKKASENLEADQYMRADTLEEALQMALTKARKGSKIAVSPGAAFFYRDFIKGKKSIRQLVTSLLQSERE